MRRAQETRSAIHFSPWWDAQKDNFTGTCCVKLNGKQFYFFDFIFLHKNFIHFFTYTHRYRLLRDRKCRLEMRYRTMPIIGVMGEKQFLPETGSEFKTPAKYFRN